jgi:DNA-binding transcriptional MerR regulator
MKPQQLAALLNIAPSTLRQWAGKDYTAYLSPTGQGIKGARRSFNEMDARILAWIALMKAQNVAASDIHAALKGAKAEGWKNLPPLPGGIANDEPIAVVPREAVEERVRALQERYETQLQGIIKEREELRVQLAAAKTETDTVRRESSETIQQLQRRITELSSQEAELRGRMQQYTIGGRQWNVLALAAVGLLIGAILMALAIFIALSVTAR